MTLRTSDRVFHGWRLSEVGVHQNYPESYPKGGPSLSLYSTFGLGRFGSHQDETSVLCGIVTGKREKVSWS